MKAKTISVIREMLDNEYKKAFDAYNLFCENLKNKYETIWIDNKINDTERELLTDLRNKYNDLGNALFDFDDHQW